MKRFSLNLIYLFAVGLVVANCTKEGPAPEMKNSITHNNTEYDISGGLLEYYGIIKGTGNNIDLILLSSGLTPVVTSGMVDSIVGTGSGINFEIFTTGTTSLDVGDYTYDATESGSPGTFDFGNAIFNFNTVTQEGDMQDMVGGKITIISNSPQYELSFQCTGADGKSVTGYYKGILQYYDMSTPFKSGKIKKRRKW